MGRHRRLPEAANQRGWWLAYRRDVPLDLHSYLSLEPEVVEIRQFESMLVPGLLQTAEYTRALINGINPGKSPHEVERGVAARMARQQILTREQQPARLHAVLDQGVIERPVGRAVVMRAQLRRLIDLAEYPNIVIQVVPRQVGAYPGLEGPFSILSLPEPVPAFGYTEGMGGSVYLEKPEDIDRCTSRFALLTELALSPDETIELIRDTAKDYQ